MNKTEIEEGDIWEDEDGQKYKVVEIQRENKKVSYVKSESI